jgi:hypothetical protein
MRTCHVVVLGRHGDGEGEAAVLVEALSGRDGQLEVMQDGGRREMHATGRHFRQYRLQFEHL